MPTDGKINYAEKNLSNFSVDLFTEEQLRDDGSDLFFQQATEVRILKAARYGKLDRFDRAIKPFREAMKIGLKTIVQYKWPHYKVKLLDLRIEHFGHPYGLNVIEVASLYNHPEIIQYLYQNKEQLGLQSKDFVDAWQYNPSKGTYEIDASIREILIQDPELVAFIQSNCAKPESMLGTQQPSVLSQVSLFADAATQTESTPTQSSATQTGITDPIVKETTCCTIS